MRLINLADCARAREDLLQGNADLALDYGDPNHFWLSHLWPIAGLGGNGTIGVDLMPGSGEALYMQAPDAGLERLPERIGTLSRLLGQYIECHKQGTYFWASGIWQKHYDRDHRPISGWARFSRLVRRRTARHDLHR